MPDQFRTIVKVYLDRYFIYGQMKMTAMSSYKITRQTHFLAAHLIYTSPPNASPPSPTGFRPALLSRTCPHKCETKATGRT